MVEPHLRSRVRSLMLAVLIVAVIAWLGVMGWRRAQFLRLAQHLREQAAVYAQAESEHVASVAQVATVEREIASAEPPGPRADSRAWRAYRDYVADLRAKLNVVRASLDELDRYRAVCRYSERLAAKYELAAMTPWIDIEAEKGTGVITLPRITNSRIWAFRNSTRPLWL
jgi:uncharacterized protein YerC